MNKPLSAHWNGDRVYAGELYEGNEYSHFRPSGSGDFLLIYTVSGKGSIVSGAGERRDLEAGDALLYEPGAFQDYGTSEQADHWELFFAHFQPTAQMLEWMRWDSLWEFCRMVSLSSKSRYEVEVAFKRCLVDARSGIGVAKELVMAGLQRVFLWCYEGWLLGGGKSVDERIQKALDLMATDPRMVFSVEDLAAKCGLSASRFAHLFKSETGATPQKTWEKMRIEESKTLLRFTSLSVSQVSARVGFEDPFYFSTRFRKWVGCSPREFRNSE